MAVSETERGRVSNSAVSVIYETILQSERGKNTGAWRTGAWITYCFLTAKWCSTLHHYCCSTNMFPKRSKCTMAINMNEHSGLKRKHYRCLLWVWSSVIFDNFHPFSTLHINQSRVNYSMTLVHVIEVRFIIISDMMVEWKYSLIGVPSETNTSCDIILRRWKQ